MHIFIGPIERTIIYLFYKLLIPIAALRCFVESIRRRSLLVPTVVNINSNPMLPLSLCAGPVIYIHSAAKHKNHCLFFANPYLTDGDFAWPVNQPKTSYTLTSICNWTLNMRLNCKHSPQIWFAPYHSIGRELTHSAIGPKLSHLGLAGTWNTTRVLAQSSSKTFPLTKIHQ